MQRLNRSASAPKGPAFVLFLGLAIVPLSLKAAGIQISFSPRMSAAADAWQQIADVFSSGYQPARTSVTSTAPDHATEPSKDVDSSACPNRQFACIREAGEFSLSMKDVFAEGVQTVSAPEPAAKHESAATHLCRRAGPQAAVAFTSAKPRPQSYRIELATLSALRMETATRCALLKNSVMLREIQTQIIERSLAIPQSVRMVIPAKSPAVPKAAQCKVRAALDSVRRIERERAMLTGVSPAEPDNCEL